MDFSTTAETLLCTIQHRFLSYRPLRRDRPTVVSNADQFTKAAAAPIHQRITPLIAHRITGKIKGSQNDDGRTGGTCRLEKLAG